MGLSLNQHKAAITKRTIAKFSDATTPEYALGGFFPSKTTTEKMVSIEVRRNKRLIAADVQRGTRGNVNNFDRYSEKLYVPPFFKESFNFVDLDVYNVTFGQQTDPSPNQALSLINGATEHLLLLKQKIEGSKELQRSQVIQTGIVTMINGDNVDFKRNADSIPDLGAGNYWADSGVNPITSIEEGIKFIRQEGKSTSRRFNLILGGQAYTDLVNNPKFKELADIRNYNIITLGNNVFENRMGMNYQLSLVVKNGQLDIWTYDEFYENADGSYTEFIDQKNAVLLPQDFIGHHAHAGVPNILRDTTNAEFPEWIMQTAAEYNINNYVDPANLAHWFDVYSAPLAIPVSVDRMWCGKVVA